MRHTLEQGFWLLETLIAIAITTGVTLTVAGAVANTLHNEAIADRRMALNDDALNALADLRAISVYDTAMFKNLANRNASETLLTHGEAPESISLSIVRSATGSNLTATVRASEGEDIVTRTQILYLEAPAPGSSVGD
jgi:hypothetical protein